MTSIELIRLNFKEIRRRSLIIWKSIPESIERWKPDKDAMTVIEMVRHVLEGEHLYHKIILNNGDLGNYKSPWKSKPFNSIKNEIEIAIPYREDFINYLTQLSPVDIETKIIERPKLNQRRKLGDFLLRMAYHESVHTGQLLSYLRTVGQERPNIWD